MKQLFVPLLLILLPFSVLGQLESLDQNPEYTFTPELMLGISAEANENFPERDLQKQFILNFGRKHTSNFQEWAYRLKAPRTGLSIGYTYLGNSRELGDVVTIMPYLEFNTFRQENLTLLVGMGGSFFTRIWDPVSNPANQAISTRVTWSFRAFMHYRFLTSEKMDYRIGVGYFHHSNGHTKLPNQGLNSFLVSLSADLKKTGNEGDRNLSEPKTEFKRNVYDYISIRGGLGQNVLGTADVFNDKKNVYTLAGEYGKVFNKTLKIGIGFYYRFYEHYYDYINNNEFLVRDGEEFDFFRENPWKYATNYGISLGAELLLNHVSLEMQLGYNIHKPAYQIDWRLNEGWDNTPREIPEGFMLGEFDGKFKRKRAVAARMGLKYYLLGTNAVPKHNVYVGAHINANLGQADFSAITMGYVYSFNYKERN